MKPLPIMLNSLRVPMLLACGLCAVTPWANAQNYYPPSPVPPDLGFSPGGPSKGQIESVNPIAGNLNLAFPVAALPPGPGGFTTGVSLTYNSALYTGIVDSPNGSNIRVQYAVNTLGGNTLGAVDAFPPQDAGGAGWDYSFRYAVWEAGTPAGMTQGSSVYLRTPDGSDHRLLLVNAVHSNGNPATSSFNTNYPNQPIYDVGVTGVCYNSGNTDCSSGSFQGTLIYASVDSTFIRLEVNTVNSANTWIAYLPAGTLVYGNFGSGGTLGQILGSETNKIQDKNGNQIQLANFCFVGSPCTTTLTDQYGRAIDLQYSSTNNFPISWTDTISQPGVNGSTQTLVNWQDYSFDGPSYDCVYNGPGQFTTCPLTGSNSFNTGFYVVSSIQLPSATTTPPTATNGPSTIYTFSYDSPAGALNWGDLHGMTKSTLASGTDVTPCVQQTTGCTQLYQVQYNYYFDNPANHRVMNTLVNPLASRILNYNETRDGAAPQPLSETTTYSFPVPTAFNPSVPPPVGGTSTITAPDGSSSTIFSQSLCTNNKAGSCSAVIYRIINPDQTQTDVGWTANSAPPATAVAAPPTGGAVNPYAQYTMQWVGGWEKGVVTAKDVNGNTTSTQEYNWFDARSSSPPTTMITGIPGTLVRTVASTYNLQGSPEYWNYRNPGLPPGPEFRRAVQATSVCNVNPCNSTNAFSTINYGYDNALTTANLTSQSSYDSALNSNLSRTWSYVLPGGAVNGNVVTATDPNNNATQITYDANHLYPITVAEAGLRTTNPVYDLNSGLLTKSTDDNGVTINYTYDNLGRQIQVKQSGNGALTRTTTTVFDDTALSAKTTQVDTGLTTTTYYDPFGRVRLTTDGAGDSVQHAYRSGTGGISYELASNPYNSTTATDGWTLITRNVGAATIATQTFAGSDAPGGLIFAGGASAPPQWGSNTNSTGQTLTTMNDPNTAACSGPTTDVQDQAGNTAKYCADGLGRLASVTDASGNVTQHSYDVLDDLTKVVQSGQTRSFEYSTTGRLTKACNPETGTANCTASPLPGTGLESYTYDPNGNLLTKTDARSVVTTYSGYDGLNRPHTKSFSDGSTPAVTYSYDVDWKGALSSISSSVGTSVYSTAYTHDGFGRVTTSTQTTGASPGYGFVYTYSLADQLIQMKYPSGRTLVYGVDSAGRITSIQNQATQKYYASNITYNPSGGALTIPLGNGLTEKDTWNDRQELTGLTAGPAGGTALLGLQLYPCPNQATACSSNNTGSLQGQTISFSGVSLSQNYSYDPVGRLSTAAETGNWSQSYGYAPTGNRYLSANSGVSLSPFTPTASTDFDANNRLQFDSATYDPSGNGNQTSIGGNGGYVYTYDAENRMTGAYQGTVSTAISSTGYVYDGEGQRVQKVTCAAGTNPCTPVSPGASLTTYIYDAFGNLAAEYMTAAVTSPKCQTCYVTVDHLGSTRLLTDENGNVVERHDYLPSGEELFANGTARTTGQGYLTGSSAETVNVLFTGQYRDQETGLDYMHFRYYSPQQGRFVTVDPGNAGADPASPQTWNGYAYVSNSPLSYTDPSGLFIEAAGPGSAAGPIGAIIGGLIDLGELFGGLFGLFGGGGNSAPSAYTDFMNSWGPTVLQPSPDVDWQPGSTVPDDGSDLYGTWNERVPINGSGGPLNLGGIFGGGSMGPFVFSATPVDPNSVELHHIFPQAQEFAAQWLRTGINIGRYLIALPAGAHRLSQFGGIHTGVDNWNAAWRKFFAENELADRDQIFEQARTLIKKFRLGLFAGADSVSSEVLIMFDLCIQNPHLAGCAGRGPMY